MIFYFAYTDTQGYEYDWQSAQSKKVLIEFELEVAHFTPAKNIAAKPFQTELLDGNIWELATKYRKGQSFTTFPDMFLTQITIGNTKYSTAQLLSNWLFARSRWIQTPDIDSGGNYAKVVRVTNDFAPEIVSDVFFFNNITLEFQTAAPYAFGT